MSKTQAHFAVGGLTIFFFVYGVALLISGSIATDLIAPHWHDEMTGWAFVGWLVISIPLSWAAACWLENRITPKSLLIGPLIGWAIIPLAIGIAVFAWPIFLASHIGDKYIPKKPKPPPHKFWDKTLFRCGRPDQ